MIWKCKPYWSAGRWLHLAEAFLATALLGWLFGVPGLVIGVVGSTVLGAGWEILNHWWPPGRWMFADIVDFLFFVIGALLAAILGVFI